MNEWMKGVNWYKGFMVWRNLGRNYDISLSWFHNLTQVWITINSKERVLVFNAWKKYYYSDNKKSSMQINDLDLIEIRGMQIKKVIGRCNKMAIPPPPGVLWRDPQKPHTRVTEHGKALGNINVITSVRDLCKWG